MTKARPGPKKVSKARRHPDQPKPFSGIREVVFNAFAKIGSPVDKTDILNISRGAAGVRVEVIKTISFLTHRQMLKLIGSIRFKSVRLTRFRIGATQHKGKSALKFLFYVQGAKAAVTAGLDVDVLETDIQAALDFMAVRSAPLHPATRLSSFFDLVAQFNANHGFHVVQDAPPPERPLRPLIVSAAVNVKELERKYRLSSFTFRFSNRDGSLDVTRSVKAYTREHGLEILKTKKQIPKGFKVSSASGKAQPKIEATASAPEFLLYGIPKGETERYTEQLLFSKGKSEDDPMIEKVKGMATKDGFHSFRVAKHVPGTRPDFGRAVK